MFSSGNYLTPNGWSMTGWFRTARLNKTKENTKKVESKKIVLIVVGASSRFSQPVGGVPVSWSIKGASGAVVSPNTPPNPE